ncbi:MAG: Tyrosine recombinase [Candidatus Levybacteria bacterium GW2011_GWC1_40_19]|nr:MAG: Tyrosine recombinase [Candidatus Levybacteria bacterium GW2011_GWA1_39_34]KKR50383.1 MAG: Tyrosine recombinase [Candidatus Levybacteria bacterium GW2011_GWC1_40_19]
MTSSMINSSSYFHLQAIPSPLRGTMIDEKDFYSFISTKEGLADNSIKNCIKTLRHINKWFFDKDLNKENTEAFFLFLKYDKKLKPNTLNAYLFVFRHLVSYCKDRGLPYDFLEGFKAFKKTKPDIIILTLNEIEAILETELAYGKFYGKDCSFLDFRDKTLIRFLAFTGCRFSEARDLKIKHLDLSAGRAIFVETKTNENRSVFFAEDLASSLKKLTEGRDPEDLVFTNSLGRRVYESDFSAQLKKRAIQAGITKRVYPHLFRHSFATQLLMSGVDVAVVSKILGHKDVRTTVDNYLHLADETLKEATFMHPLIRKNVDPSLTLKSVKKSFESFHFETDKRFRYSFNQDEKGIKIELLLNQRS